MHHTSVDRTSTSNDVVSRARPDGGLGGGMESVDANQDRRGRIRTAAVRHVPWIGQPKVVHCVRGRGGERHGIGTRAA